ncbi:hypothetical protein GPECTOR_38g283 [Gonium pectorale]|uniref:Photosystem II reaction center Psb28 protein n=1 Tax=Gonium pectorale TaxID=33097 RepID=A0A150GB23_GONPE|nr:hypothetical protein GPECTOR_38g283 [Gonium pectorale]|eukprot:KXZ47046.1 hypothetical protein GPECTOR_38g283 [Gonium pectorale]
MQALKQAPCARGARPFQAPAMRLPVRQVACDAAGLQFIRGVNEPTIPEASGEMGEITGLFMVDDEGTLTTTDVKAKFINGKPQAIEAKFQMRSQFEWDRFLRFMDRYSQDNGLGFEKN